MQYLLFLLILVMSFLKITDAFGKISFSEVRYRIADLWPKTVFCKLKTLDKRRITLT